MNLIPHAQIFKFVPYPCFRVSTCSGSTLENINILHLILLKFSLMTKKCVSKWQSCQDPLHSAAGIPCMPAQLSACFCEGDAAGDLKLN